MAGLPLERRGDAARRGLVGGQRHQRHIHEGRRDHALGLEKTSRLDTQRYALPAFAVGTGFRGVSGARADSTLHGHPVDGYG